MGVERPAHDLIAGNTLRELDLQLKGEPCEIYSSDMRLRVAATGLETGADVVVVRGDAEFEDERQNTLLNPTVIVEVHSPATEAYDRGDKFAQYRRLPSLREYVLIAQDRMQVEHYSRQGDSGQWLLTEASEAGDVVRLAAIGCRLPLAEVYYGVELPQLPSGAG